MSRARATSLVLVNWRGVFYERYELDRHVTALEGANGAGKTTVMIAAYLVLLPDLSRLRFTNLGESGATGGDRGIFGRLGQEGAPSYAFLELSSPRHPRLVAGVQLVRKGEPSVELTTFLISDLDPAARLEDVLLLRDGPKEQVPELSELRDSVAKAAARLTVFPSAKDYLGALFEHGITPLRLAGDEERTKLNEMLKTSMTGGISRTLTNDLRSFLLRQEAGLGEILASMRGNLEACRRTRTEVQTSQVLQAEIAGVYEAGEDMFAAALHATRERAEELRRAVARAKAEKESAEGDLGVADRALAFAVAEQASVDARLEAARATWRETEERHHRVERAHRICLEITKLKEEREKAEANASALETERREAESRRDRARETQRRAEEAWTQATKGLADVQSGLDELHRRADAHRRATGFHAHIEGTLGEPVAIEAFEGTLAKVEAERAGLDVEAPRLDQAIGMAEQRRVEHRRAVTALEAITNEAVDPPTYHVRARQELHRQNQLEALFGTVPALLSEIGASRTRASAQAKVRAQAEALGLSVGTASGPAVVSRALEAATEEREAQDRLQREHERSMEQATRGLKEARELVLRLEKRSFLWRETQALLQQLEAPVKGSDDLAPLERSLVSRRDALLPLIAGFEARRDQAIQRALELDKTGGTFPRDLLRIGEQVGGELLATEFDDLDPDEAALCQARLGPLADAVVVADPMAAARALAGAPREVETVWLVSPDAARGDRSHEVLLGRDVLVEVADGVRLTQIPERPTLGRRAREARIADLHAEAARLEEERLGLCANLATLDGQLGLVAALLARREVLDLGDPASELLAAKAQGTGEEAAIERHRAASEAALGRLGALASELRALSQLLKDAWLLDPPDHAEATRALEAKHREAMAAGAELRRTRADATVLMELLDVLRGLPATPEEVEGLRRRLEDINARRGVLFHLAESLRTLVENKEALGWADAAPRLERERSLLPELTAAADGARAEMEAAQGAAARTYSEWDGAVLAAQDARAQAISWASRCEGAEHELLAIGAGAPTAEDLEASRAALVQSAGEHLLVQGQRDAAASIRATREEQQVVAAKEARNKTQAFADAEREARPHEERWARLKEHAQAQGVWAMVQAPRFLEAFTGLGSPNLSTRARTAGARLVERLRTAQQAQDVRGKAEAFIRAEEDRSAEGYLEIWLLVLDWLRRRLPAHIAEVDDPMLALARLKDELSALEERLRGQEAILRGKSEDVASHIEVQIRKAAGQVQRLNASLVGVSFGSISGIRVRLRHLESMGRILRTLRDGHGQELLFSPEMPIEEALDQLFQRHGGAGSSGQRLLDYREYIELSAEVKRHASTEWEAATATKLSTGEAIGVGAAVMMVVLAEWERDANLLRGRKSHGSLRFLFLDEANRLDRENLDEIFDLCRNLELQLLIAAPEVARAEGTTTYRLVRVVEDGAERVLVSGRRARKA